MVEIVHRGRRLRAALVVSALALSACRTSQPELGPSAVPGTEVASLTVTSRSFQGSDIPVDFTCDGTNKSPNVTWSAPPPDTKSFAIVAEDPDAPGGTFTHWVVWNINPDARTLAEGVDPQAGGAQVGLNDDNNEGYMGPCPPRYEMHRYLFRVFALNTTLNLHAGADKNALYAAMHGHVLAEGVLTATFAH